MRCSRPRTSRTGAGIEGAARAQALAEGIPESEATIVALARSVLGAPTIRAAASGRSWREVPVAAVIDGTTVEGFIDLLVADGEDLIVVDYKTDTARSDAEIDAALQRYRPQAGAPTRWRSSTCSAGRSPAASSCSPGPRARPWSVRSRTFGGLVDDVRSRLASVPTRGSVAGPPSG